MRFLPAGRGGWNIGCSLFGNAIISVAIALVVVIINIRYQQFRDVLVMSSVWRGRFSSAHNLAVFVKVARDGAAVDGGFFSVLFLSLVE